MKIHVLICTKTDSRIKFVCVFQITVLLVTDLKLRYRA